MTGPTETRGSGRWGGIGLGGLSRHRRNRRRVGLERPARRHHRRDRPRSLRRVREREWYHPESTVSRWVPRRGELARQ